jgi:DNA-binding LacI/PurR family transcriptional regulator
MSQASFQKQKLAERVAEELSTTIARQGWRPGRKLPAVRDLARQFEVSPNTAHSAVQLLAKRGVIDLQPRQGAFVQGEREVATRNQIGIIWPCQPDPEFNFDHDDWSSRILRSAELELHEAGYYTTVLGYMGSPQFYGRIESMRPHLAGALTFSRPHISPLLDKLDGWDIPWVTINAPSRCAVHNFVVADNQGDYARLGQSLAENGLRRVLVLSNGLSLSTSSMDKLLGLYEGFASVGVSAREIEVVDCADYREPFGHGAMVRYLASLPLPQVVVAHGDLLALGAVRACRERGVRVPEKVGVIGGTGLRLSELSHPPLSVMTQPMDEMGRQAARMLAEMARDGTRRLIGRRIPGQFIQRESFVLPDYQQVQSPPGVLAADVIAESASRTC